MNLLLSSETEGKETFEIMDNFVNFLTKPAQIGLFLALLKKINTEEVNTFLQNIENQDLQEVILDKELFKNLQEGLKIKQDIEMKTYKTFEEWETFDVEQFFGLKEVPEHPILKDWLDAKPDFTKEEKERLNYLRTLLTEEVRDWNEEELKIQFIAHLLDLANYREANLKTFFERPLELDLSKIELKKTLEIAKVSGKVDCLITPKARKPQSPYFCLHEYKRENSKSTDPLGQLLIAMVAAQQSNQNDKTVYGCYVSGRQWFFVILKDLEYSVSLSFDATKENVDEILSILRKMKSLVSKTSV